VVCISRAIGALGEDVGRLAADRLGFRYLDEEIVSTAAAREGVDPELVADVERRRSFVERLLAALAAGATDVYVGPVPENVAESEHYRSLIRETIEEAAAQGEVVIVAHAASHALAGREGILRVLVTASPDVRARRLGLEEDEAAKALRRSDAARADYLRRFYDVEDELPTHYDLVVNTDVLPPEQAASIVAAAATGV
jgi:hypothetical protein